MIEFFAHNWGTILTAAIVAIIAVLAALKMISDKKQGKSSCGGGCGSCPNAGLCHANHNKDKVD